jgi:DNA-binding GntR family transcriptional regulator
MTMGGPVRGYQTKTEWIYAQLRDMIHAGEFASGDRLPLAPLAERFGTSEIPVREALRMLQRDGLVTIESHRGATVSGVSWEELYEAMLIRTHLEILAVEEAVPRHTVETVADLRRKLEHLDRLAESLSPRSADEFSLANREFHRALYAPGPFPLLLEEIQDLWDRVWRTRSQSLFYMAREQMERAQHDHHAMIEAVEAKDVDEAVRLATAHRDGNLAAWRTIIERATGADATASDI